jgi:hypothetical protein
MPIWPFRSHDPTPFMPVDTPSTGKPEEPPKYVDEGRFNQAMDEVRGLGSKLDQFTGLFTGLMTGQPPPVPQTPQTEAPIDDVTDEEYADAVLRGDAAKIQKRTRAEIERAKRDLQKTYDQRLGTLERQGMGILDQVSGELGQQALGAMPYYQVLKGDIDAALKQLPAHQRTPEMRQHIYHAVVGANLDKVRAHDAAEAARIQKERDTLEPPGRAREHEQGPTPETIFGDAILRPDATWMGGGKLWAKRTPDEWARTRYGVKDVREASVYASNVMNLDDCPRCFGPIIGGKCHCRR